MQDKKGGDQEEYRIRKYLGWVGVRGGEGGESEKTEICEGGGKGGEKSKGRGGGRAGILLESSEDFAGILG